MQRCKNVTIGNLVADPAAVAALGYIAGYDNNGEGGCMWMSPNSKVSYGHKDGKFYVVYKDVMVQGLNHGTGYLSMHMVLDAQGNVTIYYDNYDPSTMLEEGILNYIGVNNIGGTDPMSVYYDDLGRAGNDFYSKLATGSVVKLVAPGKSMITSVSSADGYVGIGETRNITVKAKASDELFAGELTNHLIMLTNDPVQMSKVFNIKANITGDSFKADAAVDSAQVDFGKVFRTSAQKRTMRVLNNGTKAVTVSSVEVKNGSVSIADDIKAGFSVLPNESKDIRIVLPTDKSGTVSDVITVNYSDGKQTQVPVKAEVIGVPVATVTPESAELEVPYGSDAKLAFTLSNDGDEPLKASTEAAKWYGLESPLDTEEATVGYTYRSSDNDESVKYEWADILNDYDVHENLAYYWNNTDYREVELPFEFPFYGNKYSKMYIYCTGFIQFGKPKEDYKMFPEPPVSLPNGETFYRNIMCPLWGSHSMSTDIVDGVYYKKYDDHVVVTFKNYGNSVMDGFNFQALLYRDGTYKFQYSLDPEGQLNGIFGIAGAQDANAERGFTVGSNYVAPFKAVEVRPTLDYTLAPGKSVVIPIELDTKKIADTYDNTLHIATNDPHRAAIDVPVTLTTVSEAVPVIPEKIVVKQVYDNVNPVPAEAVMEVRNDGHKAFTITNISGKLFEEDANHNYPAQLAIYAKGGNGGDDPDPGPLSLQATDGDYSWQAYWPGVSDPIVVGEEPVKIKVMYMDVTQPATASDDITFDIEGMQPLKTHLDVFITEAPAITFDQDSIVITGVQKSYADTRTLTIGNSGKYQLDYTLQLNPTGKDVSLDDEMGDDDNGTAWGSLSAKVVGRRAIMASDSLKSLFRTYTFEPMAAKSLAKASKVRKDDAYIWDDPIAGDERTPDVPDHTNALYYPVLQPISAAKVAVMGTGTAHTDENFYAATRYQAPAEGFNLTHLFYVGTVGPLKNVDVEATVILGDNVAATKNTIGHGTLHIDGDTPSADGGYYGTPRTLKFDNPVYINPNDTFYVVMKYPAGYMGNALMVGKDGDTSDNRYMAYLADMGGWVDIEAAIDASYSYGAFGYFMTCLEEQPGKPWIQLSADTKTAGTVEVGKTAEIKLDLTASAAYYDKGNKATLVVRSNDPENRVYNYHIYLDRNGAPVITAPKSTTTAPQGGSALVKVSVADEEGDAFKVSVADANSITSIDSYANADGTQEGLSLADGVLSVAAGKTASISVKVAPTFDTNAGLNLFTVYATDANGNESQADVKINIEATNRAPQYIGADDYTLAAGTMSSEFAWTSLFEEPDGESMTFDATVVANDAATVYKSNTGFVIGTKKESETTLVLSATDEQGAKTTVKIPLHITGATGISGVGADESGISADGSAVTVNGDADNAEVYLYDVAGKLLAHASAKNLHAGDKVNLGIGTLAQGVYTVIANIDGKTAAAKFAVK